jgi:hypothetical protein
MNIKHYSSEKGQAVIFLVVGLVVFLGFVALAIDGGMAYSDRRHSQNSSDSSSLAGAGLAAIYMEDNGITYYNWDGGCENDEGIYNAKLEAVEAAINRAAANGFDLNAPGSWVVATCGIDNWGWEDRYIDVTVHISSTTETSFAQLLFPNALTNQVDSTTRIRPRQPLAFGNAIVGLNPSNCTGNDGVSFGGSMSGDVSGGGVWSNGCMRGNGGAYGIGIEPPYEAGYAGEWQGQDNIDPGGPSGYQHPIPPDFFEVPMPNCDGHWVDPGEIDEDTPPGLYCIDGNLSFGATDDIVGHDVTIFVDGNLSVNGGATVNLDAPSADPDPSPAVPGLLFYVTGDVTVNGNSGQAYTGLVYAPGPPNGGDCTFNGTGDTWETLHTQIICWNVGLTGSASIDIHFNQDEQYQKPTSMELRE